MSETPSLLFGGSLIGIVVFLVILSTTLSALLERGGLIRLRHWALEAGGRLHTLYGRRGRFAAFRLLLGALSRLSLVLLFVLILRTGASLWVVWAGTLLGLLAAELISRILVARDPEEALRRLTPAYSLAFVLLRPLVVLIRPLVPRSALERRIDDSDVDEASEGEIEAFIDVGQREGILEPGEDVLVKGVVEFGDTLVKSVMTPRTEVAAAPAATDLDELVELFMASSHSRIPLYEESMDQIVGILHIRDLLSGVRSEEDQEAIDLAMEPFVVPETKRIFDLLREFQAGRRQIAVVVDEFGGTSGLVTVEDLLEEIVGDIADEHDQQETWRLEEGDDVWRLSGACPIEELEALYDVGLGDAPYETVGGLVFAGFGYLPEPGEEFQREGLAFEVLSVGDRRIRSVRVRRADDSS